MRAAFWNAAFIALAMNYAGGQQSSLPASNTLSVEQPTPVSVYSDGPGVLAPELIPLTLPPFSPVKCKQRVDGKVELSVLIDAEGHARNIMFIHPVGTEVDSYALRIAEADRFKPGSKDGKPVVVAQSLDLAIQSCLVESADSTGKKSYRLALTSSPDQHLGPLANPPEHAVLSSGDGLQGDPSGSAVPLFKAGSGISTPVPIFEPEAEFSDEAREKGASGTCLFSLIVDAHGMPWAVQETGKLGYGLDETARAAVIQYRFKPAMKDDQPIPVRIKVEVSFRFRRD